MIIDRSHLRWIVFVTLAAGVAGFLYLANFKPQWLPVAVELPAFFGETPPKTGSAGQTPLGLIFGIVSFLIFIFAALLGARKRRPTLRVGRAQTWLKGHIWLTLLTVPLIFFHAGFIMGGPMTQFLMFIYGVVMVSGIFGLALQHFLPRVMKDRVPMESIFEQIPFLRSQLLVQAKAMRQSFDPKPIPEPAPVAPGAAPAPFVPAPPGPDESVKRLMDFMDRTVLPYLAATKVRRLQLSDEGISDDLFRVMNIGVAPTYHPLLQQLQGWCDERRQLDLQSRLHHWMHGWLFVHVPLSLFLLLLTAWHALVAVVRY